MLNVPAAVRFTSDVWDEQIIPTLCEYIRIPNKSPMFDPQWEANGHMQQAVEMLAGWADNMSIGGLQTEIISLPGRTPVIFAEVPSTGGDQTVLLYGHYDKQPEFSGWAEGLDPWLPVIRDNRLYGRGGADDGYAWFASLCAIAALENQNIPHGRCVALIEGCEESGSFDLPFYVAALKDRIGNPDLVVCLDAECGNYDQLWLTSSLRGMLPGTLSVTVLTEGQHSGAAGGIVPSSFRILRNLLDRIEDSQTGTLHECLHVDIPQHAITQLNQVAQTLGPVVLQKFPWAGNTGPEADDVTEVLINNAWRPSLATVGLSGAPEVHNAGNTLRPMTCAKLVIRLPPTADAAACAQTIKSVLEADPPYGAQVKFDLDTAQTGWLAPAPAAWLEESAERASRQVFGRSAMYMGMGGTIPFMKMLGDAYPDVQFMVSGVLGPKSNAHGPNEFLDISTGKRLTVCVSMVLADHAARPT
ncbi:MAG: M20/M25/M40 family metallo-hydrolase [Proteobacteria bacterium]|nr:M20/M25/M40 family metallo-hydrolase [Pseudomonadota bacterium]